MNYISIKLPKNAFTIAHSDLPPGMKCPSWRKGHLAKKKIEVYKQTGTAFILPEKEHKNHTERQWLLEICDVA